MTTPNLISVLFAALFVASPVFAATPPVDAWCDDLASRLRSVSPESCKQQDFQIAQSRTQQGRALIWRDLNGNAKGPRVLVIGGIHGDELTSVSIVFRWQEWVGETEAKRYRWRMIPAANPDGLMAKPPTRVNASGADLNRNFPTPDWDKDAQDYWSRRTGKDPRRYPGKAAASEIETRWLQQQIDEFKPDVIISIHAPYNLLDYDGPAPQPMRFGRLTLNRLGVYPGSLGNYAGLHKKIPVVTIELPNATTMPSTADQRAMWQDMHKWMRKNIKPPKAASSKKK